MHYQTPESLMTAIVIGAIGIGLLTGFLIHKTTALDGLVRVAALVIYGDAS
jgi:hypothetical protein